jgi:hypothetical protein
MKKLISVLVLFAIVLIAFLVMRARTRDSGGSSANVVLDRTVKAGDIVTNGNSQNRLQRVLVRGTNVPPEKNEVPK